MKWLSAAQACLACLALVGCGSTPEFTTSVTTATSSRTESVPVSPQRPLPLGSTFTLTDPGVTVEATVFSVDQNILSNSPAPLSGGHWAGVDVQLCVREAHNDFTVGWDDWSVADDDNGHYQQSAAKLDVFPTPKFPPQRETLAVGHCARGWVVFAVAVGVEVTLVKYKPSGQAPAFWSATQS